MSSWNLEPLRYSSCCSCFLLFWIRASHYSPGYPVVHYVAQDGLEHADIFPSAGIIGMSQQARLITYLRTWVWSAGVTRLNQLQFTQLAAGSWMVWTVLILPPPQGLKCLHKSILRIFKPKLPLASIIKITNMSREFTKLTGLFICKGRELLSLYLRFFSFVKWKIVCATEWGWQGKLMQTSPRSTQLRIYAWYGMHYESYCWQD